MDIESELDLIKETRSELKANCSSEKAERRTMKELGLKRSDTHNLCMCSPFCNIICYMYLFCVQNENSGLGSLGGQTPMSSPRQWGRCCWGTCEATFRWSSSGRASSPAPSRNHCQDGWKESGDLKNQNPNSFLLFQDSVQVQQPYDNTKLC